MFGHIIARRKETVAAGQHNNNNNVNNFQQPLRLLGSATNLEPTKGEQPQQQQRLNWQNEQPGQDRFTFLGEYHLTDGLMLGSVCPVIKFTVFY